MRRIIRRSLVLGCCCVHNQLSIDQEKEVEVIESVARIILSLPIQFDLRHLQMPPQPSESGQRPDRRGMRVSLACIQCRSRHLRCDAATPTCARCVKEGCQCTYVKSRRGNRPRAQQNTASLISQLSIADQASIPAFAIHYEDGLDSSLSSGPSKTSSSITSSFSTPDHARDAAHQNWDPLLDLYFTCFHPSHPCVLPQAVLKQRLQSDDLNLQFLLQVIRYIGSFYTRSIASEPLEEQVKISLPHARSSQSPFDIQALVLYATAVYWSNQVERARSVLDAATSNALAIGMNLQFFATKYACEDAVLAESWRRTWWTLYATDLHMAGANHEPTFPTSVLFVPATVDLPCEDDEYNSGV